MSENEQVTGKTPEDYAKESASKSPEDIRSRIEAVVASMKDYVSYLEPLEAELVGLINVADEKGIDVEDLVGGIDFEDDDDDDSAPEA
jgi:hypothetical protein